MTSGCLSFHILTKIITMKYVNVDMRKKKLRAAECVTPG